MIDPFKSHTAAISRYVGDAFSFPTSKIEQEFVFEFESAAASFSLISGAFSWTVSTLFDGFTVTERKGLTFKVVDIKVRIASAAGTS
jgi:hypothetical protein